METRISGTTSRGRTSLLLSCINVDKRKGGINVNNIIIIVVVVKVVIFTKVVVGIGMVESRGVVVVVRFVKMCGINFAGIMRRGAGTILLMSIINASKPWP